MGISELDSHFVIVFFYLYGQFAMVMPPPKHAHVHHHAHTFMGNLPILECWDCNYFPRPNPLLVHDTLAMLTGTQMVSLCTYSNHFSNYS